MNIKAIWNMGPRSFVVERRFGVACCLHHQNDVPVCVDSLTHLNAENNTFISQSIIF
jgi:hypothetical protein